MTGAVWTGTEVNIFTQIGFVVLVGLAAKNAILIVEFAKQQRQQGRSRQEAALVASRLRLRPILMTSLAFIFGVIPLVFASGAGAEMRQTLGIAVFSGMLGVTFFGIFLTPVFFSVIQCVQRPAEAGGVTLRARRGISRAVLGIGFVGNALRGVPWAGRRPFSRGTERHGGRSYRDVPTTS